MVSVTLNKQDSVCGNITRRQKRVLTIQISILTEDDHTWSATGLNFRLPSIFNIYKWPTTIYSRSKTNFVCRWHNRFFTDNSQEALQTKLFLIMKQLETWFLNNDLIINITKRKAMSFHLCNSKPTYKPHILLHNKDIEYKSEVKFLGLCITENLNWRPHICYLCNNLCKSFFVIKSVKTVSVATYFGTSTLHFFMHNSDMGLYYWGGGGQESVNTLRIQKNVIRLITV